jgi:hypothetical protein
MSESRVDQTVGPGRVTSPLLVLVGATITSVFTALILRHGILSTPDGWGYWQGSVSLLQHRGFTYFFADTPILDWVPLYSIYLLAWQYCFGVSGAVIIAANVALAAAAGVGWCMLFQKLVCMCGDELGRSRTYALAGGTAFIAVALPLQYTSLAAESLVMALLPVLIISTLNAMHALWGRAFVANVLIATASSTLLLLAHNRCIAFALASSILIVRQGGRERFARILAASVVSGVAIILWTVVRHVLGQSEDHRPGIGLAAYSAAQYFWQLIGSVSKLLGRRAVNQVVVWAVIFGQLLFMLHPKWMMRDGTVRVRRCVRTIWGFALLSIAFIYLMFNFSWVSDPLTGRFPAYLVLLIVPPAIICAAALGSPKLVVAASFVLLMMPAMYLVKPVEMGVPFLLAAVDRGDVPHPASMFCIRPWHSIRRDVTALPVVKSGDHLIIPPPFEPWFSKR